MIWNFLSSPIVLAALASFFAGSFGYVIAVRVVRPVFSYRRLRRRIDAALTRVMADPASGGAPEHNAFAVKLTDAYQKALPQWYRLSLSNRGENPIEAARHLTRLAKTRDREQVARRIAAVRTNLRLN